MTVWLYRRTLSVRSGAGNLMLAQARGLQTAGAEVRIAAQRGTLRFLLRTGFRARRVEPRDVEAIVRAGDAIVVDHEPALAGAHIVFVHNLFCEAVRYLDRDDWRRRAAAEAAYFARLDERVPVVVNSKAVAAALEARLGVARERIAVVYPGFDSRRFDARRVPVLRAQARARLGVDAGTALVGFITSGDLQKRGLDTFVASAERLAARADGVRFLVVGADRLPEPARRHELFASGRALYRPRGARPELWLAALDLFLYPACYEEFGLVVAEAAAFGLPVLTSRRVGAVECLPDFYEPWLLDTPDAQAFADAAAALLDDADTRARLGSAGARAIRQFDQSAYARRSAELILGCRAQDGS
jgi:glycosyltransferase involved in cell wall biosynthesis